MYRPRHNGVIVTSGRGVIRGMAVGVVRDHNAGECQRRGGGGVGGRINRAAMGRAAPKSHFIELY